MSLSEMLRSFELSLSFLCSRAWATQSAIIARRHLLSLTAFCWFWVEWNLGRSPEVKRGGQLNTLIRCWRCESPCRCCLSCAVGRPRAFVGTFTTFFTSAASPLFAHTFLMMCFTATGWLLWVVCWIVCVTLFVCVIPCPPSVCTSACTQCHRRSRSTSPAGPGTPRTWRVSGPQGVWARPSSGPNTPSSISSGKPPTPSSFWEKKKTLKTF